MPATITVTESQPTVRAGSYTHAGRGGAGNTFRANDTSESSSRPIKTSSKTSSKSSSRAFYSGIGGAGNAHRGEERLAINFDEEFQLARHRELATTGHVGRGGAGNVFREKSSGSRRDSHSSAGSTSSSGSSRFLGRLSGSFSRH